MPNSLDFVYNARDQNQKASGLKRLNPGSHQAGGSVMETDKAKLYFQRLRLLLIAVFMLVALVPLVSFGYIGISQGKQMIQDKAAVYLMNLSGRNAQSIVQFMMERANDINALASLFHLSDKTFESHIRQVKADPNRPYIDFYILDGAGRPVFTTADAGTEPGIPDLSEDLRPLWKGICIHPLVPGPAKGGAVLMLSRRLSGTGEDRPAYLVALVDFLFIDRLMRENTMEDTGEVYLVDQGGGFLSSSRFGAKALETPDARPGRAFGPAPGFSNHGTTAERPCSRPDSPYRPLAGRWWLTRT